MSLHVRSLRNSIGLLLALSFALVLPGSAQPAKDSHAAGIAAFDATREITLQGTIRDVVTQPAAGNLMGVHLTVASTTGTTDVHLGSLLSKAHDNLLRAGASVIVVGSFASIRGHQVLLARQLVVGGQVIPVRDQHGFLIRPQPRGRQHRAAKTAGGAE